MKRNLITIIISLCVLFGILISPPENTSVITEVTALTPQKRNIYDYVNASGRIKERTKKSLYADNAIRITKAFVKVGDKVSCGDPLFSVEYVINKSVPITDYDLQAKAVEEVFNRYGFDISIDNEKEKVIIDDNAHTITSPINGVVTFLNDSIGEDLLPLSKLTTISDFSDLYVRCLIPEEFSNAISNGESVEISADSFGKTTYKGKIQRIYPVAKYIPSLTGEGKTYVEADIITDKIPKKFKPELSVNVKIAAKKIKNALTIPYECICQDNDGKEYIFYVKNNTANKNYITVGYELEDFVEIKEGIEADYVIIKNPTEAIIDGTEVYVKE